MLNAYMQMRQAGAAADARAVSAAEITIKAGVITHASSKTATFGEIAPLATKQPVPEIAPIKVSKDYVFIGKDRPRLDTMSKTNGSVTFTLDQYRDGMLTLLVAHAPKFGATVKSYDDIATQSIMMGTVMEPMLNGSPDPFTVEGSAGLAYNLGARRIGWKRMQSPVSVLWFRSVGHTYTGFAVESFLDQVLEASGKDAIQGRLDLLPADATRERAVIEKVRDISGWKGRTADGKGYGFAFVKSFGSYVAQVLEVTEVDGAPRVSNIWRAVDCGMAVNPNLITAQVEEGGVGFALTTALYSEITLAEGGEVAQSNHYDYPILRINEMPNVIVAIIESPEAPSAIGEPGVPPVAPALAHAWPALTQRAINELPFSRQTA